MKESYKENFKKEMLHAYLVELPTQPRVISDPHKIYLKMEEIKEKLKNWVFKVYESLR